MLGAPEQQGVGEPGTVLEWWGFLGFLLWRKEQGHWLSWPFSLLPQGKSDPKRGSKDELHTMELGHRALQGLHVECGANLDEQQLLQRQELPKQIRA